MFTETKYNLERFQNEFPLPFILNSIGSNQEQEDVNRPSGHYCTLVIWVTEGEGVFEINGDILHLTAGKGVYIAMNVPHSYYKTGNVFATSWFSFVCPEGLISYYQIGDYFCFDSPSLFDTVFNTVAQHCYGDSDVISRSGVGYAMLIEFLQVHFAPTQPLEVIVDQYLENHFYEYISLEDIANEVNMNKFALCRYYANAKGSTIITQLKKIRIAKAKRYLLSTNLPISKIGQMCGFESPSYFIKIFKEETSISPKHYRDRYLTI